MNGPALGPRSGVALIFVSCLGVANCAHRAEQPPELVHRFAAAVAGRDWRSAYALMSATYQRRVPFAKFLADMEAETAIVGVDAAQLSRERVDMPRLELFSARGDRLVAVLEGDAWKLDDHPLTPFAQDSARAALRTFVRALDRRRYDVLLRLVPAGRSKNVTVDTLRAYWEGEGSQSRRNLLEKMRAALNSPIVDLGSEAHMPLEAYDGVSSTDGDGDGEVRFLLEDGTWKIDELR